MSYKETNKHAFEQMLYFAAEETKKNGPTLYPTGRGDERLCLSEVVGKAIDSMNAAGLSKFGAAAEEVRSNFQSAIFTASALSAIEAREQMHHEIENLVNSDKYMGWLENNGISESDREPFISELKDYVTETLNTSDISKDVKYIDKMTQRGNDREARLNNLYANAVPYITKMTDTLSRNIRAIEGNKLDDRQSQALVNNACDIAFRDSFPFVTIPADSGLCQTMIVNTARDIKINPSASIHTIEVMYGKDDEVHPTDFLEHYNQGKPLTKEEQEWARRRYADMADSVMSDVHDINSRTDWGCFMANGEQIISRERMDAFNGLSSDKDRAEAAAKMEQDIVAAMLSGKEITAVPHNSDKRVMINPTVSEPQKPKFSFSNIIKWFKSLFSSAERDKAKAKVDEMNANFADNLARAEDKNARSKISFRELAGTDRTERITQRKDKDNQKTISMDGIHM